MNTVKTAKALCEAFEQSPVRDLIWTDDGNNIEGVFEVLSKARDMRYMQYMRYTRYLFDTVQLPAKPEMWSVNDVGEWLNLRGPAPIDKYNQTVSFWGISNPADNNNGMYDFYAVLEWGQSPDNIWWGSDMNRGWNKYSILINILFWIESLCTYIYALTVIVYIFVSCPLPACRFVYSRMRPAEHGWTKVDQSWFDTLFPFDGNLFARVQ
jgi:hypothetical protein